MAGPGRAFVAEYRASPRIRPVADAPGMPNATPPALPASASDARRGPMRGRRGKGPTPGPRQPFSDAGKDLLCTLRPMKVPVRLATSAVALATAASVVLPGAVAAIDDSAPIRNVGWYSANWAGYIVEKGSYTRVSGTWTVPSVSAGNYGYSAVWLGIGGVSESDLIQVGTEQDSRFGQASYSAWWEILPAPAVPIPSLKVRPGDKVTASISRVSGTRWKIAISVAGRGSFSTTRTYVGSGRSAEWIVEAPTLGWRTAPLARHSPVRFDVARANGSNPKLTTSMGGAMIQRGVRVATPSAPDRQRDGFLVARSSSAPAPNCAAARTAWARRPRPVAESRGTGAGRGGEPLSCRREARRSGSAS
jgi:hypothetical protein